MDAERIATTSPFLRGLPPAWLRELLARGTRRTAAAGERLLSEGEPARALVLVLAGEVVVTRGDEALAHAGGREREGALFGRAAVGGPPEAATVSAAGPVTLLSWDEATLAALPQAPAIAAALDTRLSLRHQRAGLAEVLRRLPLFAAIGTGLSNWLLDVSSLARYQRGEALCEQDEAGDALFVLVRGEVTVTRRGDDGDRPLATLRAGDSFGERAALNGSARNATVRARGEVLALLVWRQTLEVLVKQSPLFRQLIAGMVAERSEQTAPASAEVTLFLGRGALPLGRLVSLAAESVRRQFGDRVLVVELAASPPSAGLPGSLVLEASDAARVRALADRDVEHVFCFAEKGAQQQAVAAVGSAATAIVYVTDEPDEPFPHGGLGNRPIRFVATGAADKPGAATRSELHRLRVELAALAERFDALSPAASAAIGRLARVLTRRTVGVALGGGAGWGWAHVPLLRQLVAAQIPIDFIAGVSFGACVGACFASGGLSGLEHLVATRHVLALGPGVAPITTWSISAFFELILARSRFEDLEVPFFAVAVDILSGDEKVFRRGNVPDALRASCSLPGYLGPTILDGRRYVDGSVRNNVPTNVLSAEGADFIIASNVVPAPRPLPPEPDDTLLERLRGRLSPFRRFRDAYRSFYLLGNTMGDRSDQGQVYYSPDLSRFPLPDYGRAVDIIAAAEPGARAVVREAVDKYRAFSGSEVLTAPPSSRLAAAPPPPPPEEPAPGPSLLTIASRNFFRNGYLAGLRAFGWYFRYETEGYEHVLEGPSALLVGYHGRPFAWDLGLLSLRIHDDLGEYPRPFTLKTLGKLPFYRQLAEGFGAMYDAPNDDELARIRTRGLHLQVMPGGLREALRPFWRAYEVDFGRRRGYLRFADRHDFPIIPVAATGVDHGYLGLNDGYRLSKRLFGNGMIPAWIGVGLFGVYPFVLPWPVKIRQRVGPRIDLGPIKARCSTEEEFLETANAVVVSAIQTMLDDLRQRH